MDLVEDKFGEALSDAQDMYGDNRRRLLNNSMSMQSRRNLLGTKREQTRSLSPKKGLRRDRSMQAYALLSPLSAQSEPEQFFGSLVRDKSRRYGLGTQTAKSPVFGATAAAIISPPKRSRSRFFQNEEMETGSSSGDLSSKGLKKTCSLASLGSVGSNIVSSTSEGEKYTARGFSFCRKTSERFSQYLPSNRENEQEDDDEEQPESVEDLRRRVAENAGPEELTSIQKPRHRKHDDPSMSMSYGQSVVKLNELQDLVDPTERDEAKLTDMVAQRQNDTLMQQLRMIRQELVQEGVPSDEIDEKIILKSELSYNEWYAKLGSHIKARQALKNQKEDRFVKKEMLRHIEQVESAVTRLKTVKRRRRDTQGVARLASSINELVTEEYVKKLKKKEDAIAEKHDRIGPTLKQVYAQKERLAKLQGVEGGDKKMELIAHAVEKAVLSGELELKGKKITPHELLQTIASSPHLVDIVELRVSKNELTSLPNDMGKHLKQLKMLDASQNQLTALPPDIGDLIHLEELRIQYNRLENIENFVYSGLPNLKRLNAAGNQLTEIKESIGKWGGNLEVLQLDNNRIVQLPGDFAKLGALETLNLNYNALETLALIRIPEPPKKVTKVFVEEDWKPVRDHKTGEQGFMNIRTGECRRRLDDLREASQIVNENELENDDMETELAFLNEVDFIAMERDQFRDNKKKSNLRRRRRRRTQDSDLLDGWEEHWDDDSGLPYYYNENTGESTWDRPMNLELDLSKLNTAAQRREDRIRKRQALAKYGIPEWKFWIDSETGDTCYGNVVTKEVVYETIPRDIDRMGLLKSLQVLSLNCNRLTSLPASLGRLTNLRKLEANHNRLVSIPLELTNISCLEILLLGENRLEALPETIGNLKRLEILKVGGNRLRNVPNSLDECTSLKQLDITGNQIEALNPCVGRLKQLEELWILDNAQMRHPSKEIREKGLQHILWDCRDRAKRQLMGAPPPAKFRNVGVAGEHKVVEGRYHKDLYAALDKAQDTGMLRLHFMGLRSLPERVIHLTGLRELRISGHKEFTDIPSHLSRLKFLEIISFSGNGLIRIPDTLVFWSSFKELKELDLSDNYLDEIPPAITVLGTLTLLSASGNRIDNLSGACFAGALANSLVHLRLENNRLSTLPEELGNLTSLEVLFLTNNKIIDLPSTIGSLKKLKKLHMSNNRITFLPDSFGELESLQVFQLARNMLGEIPASFCNPSGLGQCLEMLNVQANQLIELPPEFKHMGKLDNFSFDLNPIRSPPQQLHGEPWKITELLEYCEERERRIKLIGELLSPILSSMANENASDFQFESSRLRPTCHDAVIDIHGFLTTEDRSYIDGLLDRFVNSDFYDFTMSGFEVAEEIKGIYKVRKNALFRQVLDSLLRLIETANRFALFPDHTFSKDAKYTFGRDRSVVDCYAFKLDALFNPILPLGAQSKTNLLLPIIPKQQQDDDAKSSMSANSAEHDKEKASESGNNDDEDEDKDEEGEEESSEEEVSDDSYEGSSDSDESENDPIERYGKHETWPSIVDAVKRLPRDHAWDFEHPKSLVQLALEHYQGPYGYVSWVNAPFKFPGEESLGIPDLDQFLRMQSDLEKDEEAEANDKHFQKDKREALLALRAMAQSKRSLLQTNGSYMKQKLAEGLERFLKWRNERRRAQRPTQMPGVFNNRKESRPQLDDGRHVVILSQLIYTDEEAKRRAQEESQLEKSTAKALNDLREWVLTTDGEERLMKATMNRLGAAADRYYKVKREMKGYTDDLVSLKNQCEMMQEREEAFKAGKPFDQHRFKSPKECKKLVDNLRAKFDRAKAKVEKFKPVLEEAKARQKMKVRDMKADTTERLFNVVATKTRNQIVIAARKEAMKRGLRRPWDGHHGSSFELWKLQYKREKADQGDSDSESEDEARKERKRKYRQRKLQLELGEENATLDEPDEQYESDFDKLDDIDMNN